MPTLTVKVSAEFQSRLKQAARERKLPVSEVVRSAVEKDLPKEEKGWLLGSLKKYSTGPSTYDPSKPVFDEDEWDHLKQ